MSTARRFTNISKLGEGTYGSVYQATELATGKIVAFKRILITCADDGVPGTALREICLLKELRHDNIVILHEVLFEYPKLTLVFERCDYDLKKYMELKPSRSLDCDTEVRPILKQLFRGLRYMHRRSVVHRDMKPQNVFLNIQPAGQTLLGDNGVRIPSGTTPVTPQESLGQALPSTGTAATASPSRAHIIVKLGDFGLARVENIAVKKYSHEVVTLWYRSPDVLMGSALYSFPVDVWSMGCIFYEMVTGKVLFSGRNEDEQLLKMFRLFGSPTAERWPSMMTYPDTKERIESLQRMLAGHSKRHASSSSSPRSTSPSKSVVLGGSVAGAAVGAAMRDEGRPPENSYSLPPELWFPYGSFNSVMINSGFYSAVGDDGVDLLRRCLLYEPRERITAEEAMQHPFLRGVYMPSSGSTDQYIKALEQALAAAGL